MLNRLSGAHYRQDGGSSRMLEDVAFGLGIFLVGLRGVAEVAHEVAGSLMELREHRHQFPWAFILSCGLLVLPKTVGRATAGKVWGAIGDGLGRLVGRGRPAGPGDDA